MKKIFLVPLALLAWSCQNTAETTSDDQSSADSTVVTEGVVHPEWTDRATIYEVNVRQHTPEGTFNAFAEKLPEVQALGAKILWIMPIQPIGELKRKGGLGSYYSIQDYTAVNPEFGTMDDFKALVNKAHEMGFKVILDWVANHTSWDARWMDEHPDWYTTNEDGEVIAPVEDWSDVADLNYDNPQMREAMLDAMKFWVNEADVDGYRCDVAMMVPMDFWNEARRSLDEIKPVFMLAEAEGPEFHAQAFDMTYGWEFHHIMNEIAALKMTFDDLDTYQAKMDSTYSEGAFRMFFTTNHDENSWNGTVQERMGANARNFFVLSATFPNGMPLIYSGQEYGLNKRLAFFEKDTINGSDTTLYEFYQFMMTLKLKHDALAMNAGPDSYRRYPSPEQPELFVYERRQGDSGLLVVLNFGDNPISLDLKELGVEGKWTDLENNSDMAREIGANDFLLLDYTP